MTMADSLEAQVQAVRRRMVSQQVHMLRLSGLWAAMDTDVVADCVLAAGCDAVVAHQLLIKWLDQQGPRTPDMTAADEQTLVQFIRERAPGYECDCGTCGPIPHGARIQHGEWPR